MNKRWYWLPAALLLFFVACEKQPLPPINNENGTKPPFSISLNCQGAVVIDYDTGDVLYSMAPDFQLVPASMTKVMTMYITFDHIEKGYLSLDSQIPISAYASSRSVNPGESNVPLTETPTYSVDELIGALCVVSGNACAVALGEYFVGGLGTTQAYEKQFAKEVMNHYADSLGLDAHFDDASGLSSGNYITPLSMAKLTRDFIRRFPIILEYTSKTKLNFRGTIYGTTNGMLPGMSYAYPGCDGFKTGYTTAAGLCITTTAKMGTKRVIAVVMKAPTSALRYKDASSLMDYGFSLLFD
ncbi:MAG TPA: D-alanyl-D-alanine carboxypeptidase family protein [Bacteroidales bacterium]|nr:D-alanyl-D-alanine carboxypeptidase family protein [Bacteroidales bacterium]HQB22943.1 D-alanyl-D-alanine carboxypeptidase family protein [Bacteroidales bacterium]